MIAIPCESSPHNWNTQVRGFDLSHTLYSKCLARSLILPSFKATLLKWEHERVFSEIFDLDPSESSSQNMVLHFIHKPLDELSVSECGCWTWFTRSVNPAKPYLKTVRAYCLMVQPWLLSRSGICTHLVCMTTMIAGYLNSSHLVESFPLRSDINILVAP